MLANKPLTAQVLRGVGTVLALMLVASMVMGASSSRIVWEAENYTSIVAPMTVGSSIQKDKLGRTPSGGKYLTIPAQPDEESPAKAVYKVRVETAGTYRLWGRKYWRDGCGNSFNVSINGSKAIMLGGDGTYNVWDWCPLAETPSLKAGVNTIEVFQNKKERGVNLDQLVLSRVLRWKPERPETPTPNVIVKE